MKSDAAAMDPRTILIYMKNKVMLVDPALKLRLLARWRDAELCYYFGYAKFAEIAGAGEFLEGPNPRWTCCNGVVLSA